MSEEYKSGAYWMEMLKAHNWMPWKQQLQCWGTLDWKNILQKMQNYQNPPIHKTNSRGNRSTKEMARTRCKKRHAPKLLKLAEKRKTTRLKAKLMRLKERQDDEVWWKVTEGDGTMWRRFDEEEKCWGVWGRRKTGVIRRWRTWPQLMCCALACGTRCPLISGARKTMRVTENKARMYKL